MYPALRDKGLQEYRMRLRKVLEEKIMPFVSEWDEAGEFPRSLHEDLYKAGVYAVGWPKQYGGQDPTPATVWQQFILTDELSRFGTQGLLASLFTMSIGLPPILAVGSEELKQRVAPLVLTGKKTICLAITEPDMGSDVAGLKTFAELSLCGKFFIVNGSKTFISGGMKADFFTTGVRTKAGVSLLLIERHFPGIKCTRLKTQGWWSSNTTTIVFEDVKVPVENLIGKGGLGFLTIMKNFNSERRGMITAANRMSRTCIEDAISYARLRHTFGKPMIQHDVIRAKLAEMARMLSASHALNCIVHEITDRNPNDKSLAGRIALCKVQATRTMEFCAREASQILGGKSYLRSGPGQRIERIYREVRVMAIGGGSEEIMLRLAAKQAKL